MLSVMASIRFQDCGPGGSTVRQFGRQDRIDNHVVVRQVWLFWHRASAFVNDYVRSEHAMSNPSLLEISQALKSLRPVWL